VYFIYPETCGVRLEDMDVLFGDASTAAGTPSLRAETDSLMPTGSPIGSDYRGRPTFTPANAIPGLALDAPDLDGNRPKPSTSPGDGGIANWLSRVVNRSRSRAGSGSSSGRYAPIRQGED